MVNFLPRAFLYQGEGRWEKTMALADHMIFKPHFIGVNRIQGLGGSQGIFLQYTFHGPDTATAPPHLLKKLKEIHCTQLFWVFEDHVIC